MKIVVFLLFFMITFSQEKDTLYIYYNLKDQNLNKSIDKDTVRASFSIKRDLIEKKKINQKRPNHLDLMKPKTIDFYSNTYKKEKQFDIKKSISVSEFRENEIKYLSYKHIYFVYKYFNDFYLWKSFLIAKE